MPSFEKSCLRFPNRDRYGVNPPKLGVRFQEDSGVCGALDYIRAVHWYFEELSVVFVLLGVPSQPPSWTVLGGSRLPLPFIIEKKKLWVLCHVFK